MSRTEDEKWMRRCLALAAKGAGHVSPNPLVGAVVVRGGRMLGKGFHKEFGASHAEVEAIEDARKHRSDLSGATLYVNLEPCAHYGKTPPCVNAIVREGIVRVVAAMRDPNPVVAGRGFEYLRSAGVRVSVGVLKGEAEKFNEKFVKYISTGLPFVALKVAQTSDGFIAKPDGSSKWISSKQSRAIVHRLRSEYDAAVVGRRTAELDDPKLTVRAVNGRNPYRVVIDGDLRTPLKAAMFSDRDRKRTMVFFANGSSEKVRKLKAMGVQLIRMRNKKSIIAFSDILVVLGTKGIASLLVEGGNRSIFSF